MSFWECALSKVSAGRGRGIGLKGPGPGCPQAGEQVGSVQPVLCGKNDPPKRGRGALICSLHCFLKFKCSSHHGQFQATSVASMSMGLGRKAGGGARMGRLQHTTVWTIFWDEGGASLEHLFFSSCLPFRSQMNCGFLQEGFRAFLIHPLEWYVDLSLAALIRGENSPSLVGSWTTVFPTRL